MHNNTKTGFILCEYPPLHGSYLRRQAELSLLRAQNDVAANVGQPGKVAVFPLRNYSLLFHRQSRKSAFTLAEVLITLGIIGVVAAMTLPSLIQKNNERENVAKLKKMYSAMSQAYIRAREDFGTPDDWNLSANKDPQGALNIANIFSKYLSVSKFCGGETGCLYSGYYKRLNGVNDNVFDTNDEYAKIILSDGSAVFFLARDPDCAQDRGPGILKNVCALIFFDTNGKKIPNQYGKDLFAFMLTKESIVPMGVQDDTMSSFQEKCISSDATGYGCAAWVIFNENMDYLHCSDLSWDGKHKCSK